MFAGRRYDVEIGLYYNRARYYNPYTGRFLQTDPIGYRDGMNTYAYCKNNSLNFVDPSGLIRIAFYDPTFENTQPDLYEDNPGLMREWADDTYFDLKLPMYSAESVLSGLRMAKARGYEITEVFFFDHAWGVEDLIGTEIDIYALEFGDEMVHFNDEHANLGKSGMQLFAENMRRIIGEGVEYHFRNCLLGSNRNVNDLENLAKWTKGTVTGATGLIRDRQNNPETGEREDRWMSVTKRDPETGKEYLVPIDIPDYSPWGSYRQAVYHSTSGEVNVSYYFRPVVEPPLGYGPTMLTY
jgi:RHS repeat-associated protein